MAVSQNSRFPGSQVFTAVENFLFQLQFINHISHLLIFMEVYRPVVKLTESCIKNNLQCPEGKHRIEFCDTELPGLYIEVRATSQGQGTYYLRYKDSTGKTCHQKIARTMDITLVEARKRAKTLKAEIAWAVIHAVKKKPGKLY